ncbi:MAG: FtsX-like permease family protein [Prevotellaceae bacterium]|jgi:putative ABC transport system permease protein|nr:FtsX-like permease family protein [Prevotellaceae bacterium]
MLLHYLKIVIRSILREKMYSVISIFGLGIGVICSLLFLVWLRYELSYDNFYKKAPYIYRVMEVEQKEGRLNYNIRIKEQALETLKETFPQVEQVTYIRKEWMTLVNVEGNSVYAAFCNTNKSFFDIFDFKFIEGSAENAFNTPGAAVISTKVARVLFGNTPAFGKQFSAGVNSNYTVTGVAEIPENTHISFDALAIGPGFNHNVAYMLVNKNAKFTDDIRIQMSGIPATINKNSKAKLIFQPLRDMHLHSDEDSFSDSNFGNMQYIIIFMIAALLILIIAIINYVNIATARSANKAKEVGVRKVLGASRSQLVYRFLSESLVISFISVVIAFCLIEFLLPFFGSIIGTHITFHYDLGTIAIAVGICLFTGLLSGSYAAFYMSSLNPIIALKGISGTGSKEGLRKILLGAQFSLSIIIMLCTLIVYRQLNYVMNTDLGFDRANVLKLNTSLWYNCEDFQNELEKNPDIISTTMASGAPFNVEWGYSNVSWANNPNGTLDMKFYQLCSDYRFAKTFGMEVAEGRYIQPGWSWWQDADEESVSLVINETFKKYMGVDDPIGMEINYMMGKGKIIGVVKDFHFRPFKEAISPLIISYNPEVTANMYIKVSSDNVQNTIKYIEDTYNKFKKDGTLQKNRPFMLTFLEDEYRDMYKNEFRLMKILGIFAIISLFISCMGVVSMVSFMVERRSKEIAIRKINGAQMSDIMHLFVREFAILVCISAIIASPVTLYLVSSWLDTFVYRVSISPLIFIIVVIFVLLITILTLSTQIYRAARRNPVISLRNE